MSLLDSRRIPEACGLGRSAVIAILAFVIAALVHSAPASAAPNPASWDKAFGNSGSASLPLFTPFREQSVASCSEGRSGRVRVIGVFGKYVSSARRSALAQVSRNGQVVRSGAGQAWRRTPFIHEDGMYELTDGSYVLVSGGFGNPKAKLKRVTAAGRPDDQFGNSGSLAMPVNVNTDVFPIDRGQFLITRQRGSTTVVRRYSNRGGLVRGFGGSNGVRVDGEVIGATSIGSSGSVVLVTRLTTRSPIHLLELVDSDGRLDAQFKKDGVFASPDYLPTRSRVDDIVVRGSSIYVLAASYPTPADETGPLNFRIVKLNSRGSYVSSSGVVDTFGYPGDSGEPDEFERNIWTTPRGIHYARIEQFNSRSMVGRFSLWSAELSAEPKVDRTIGNGTTGVASSRYFVGQKIAATADGKFLVICGSTATYSEPRGEHRARVALRRLEIK